jgi:hypothetical protein
MATVPLAIWSFVIFFTHTPTPDSETCSVSTVRALVIAIAILDICGVSLLVFNLATDAMTRLKATTRALQILNYRFLSYLRTSLKIVSFSLLMVASLFVWSSGCGNSAPGLFHQTQAWMLTYWSILGGFMGCQFVDGFFSVVRRDFTPIPMIEVPPDKCESPVLERSLV